MRHDDGVFRLLAILRMASALGHKSKSIPGEDADERSEEQRWAMGVIKDQATANPPAVTWEITRLLSSGSSSRKSSTASRRFAFPTNDSFPVECLFDSRSRHESFWPHRKN